MKRTLALLTLLVAFSLSSVPSSSQVLTSKVYTVDNVKKMGKEKAVDFTWKEDGKTVSFSKYTKGKVVLLNIWATWCGPCVAAMPDLAEIAAKYKDQGVRLLALNQGEDVGRIEKFLKNRGLDIEVLLDQKGEAARSYLVQGIPQTVIIDEKGVVREVHIGYLPQLKQQLAAEIDALLIE